ncbi:MAG: dimethylsulfoniopropionate demethylase [Gammaproteobacteria bacterium]|nr:dimethylsulfoniopropionate demethylase [Gammaproteobacteria bacterium]MDH3535439.1 dimethylsulfoniopropionate demethylase [Gammaproteobacteria bacterium]
MTDKILSISRRTRSTPFTRRVEAAGVKGYTVYNHMLLPTFFESNEADYWHLCREVQVWDVSCERQIEVKGPDSERLIQLMTPRDISKAVIGQGLYAPLCDENGGLINDPVLIKFAKDDWWVSIADSDVRLWARGLALGFGLDVRIREAAIWPLAVQGPKAEELVTRVFGPEVPGIRFFRSRMLEFHGKAMMVMRSGYSKQGGFEIYLNDPDLAEPLWDELFDKGRDLNVRAGGPNLIERIESGLLSYGNDMTFHNNPFECGLDAFIDLDADIESMSLEALRAIRGKHEHQLVGLVFDQPMLFDSFSIEVDNLVVGDIRSQVWSSRHLKHLAMVMMKRDFLADNTSVTVNGTMARIVDIPFDFDAIS